MKILVITPRYNITGVPLAQARFAAALAERGHQVTLMIGRCDSYVAPPVLPGVTVVELGVVQVRGMLWPLRQHLRKEQPDVVFSAEDHLNCMAAAAALLAGSNTRISGSSRVPPFDTYSNRWFTKRWVLKQVMRALAWRVDVLTCVSQDMVELYRDWFPGMGHQCVYNIVDLPAARERMAEPLDDPWFADGGPIPIVAAGSLAPYKGFADLIRAVALIEEVRLIILGEGAQRAELEALIAKLGLEHRVRLPGRVANPLKYFARARIYALSSYAEGMPNVLVEAMLCGCTPVATDCRTGPRELLQGGRYGYLAKVGDPAGLAAALRSAMAQPVDPQLLAEAVAPFAQDRVIDRHFELLGLSGN